MYQAHELCWRRRTPASFLLDAFLMLAQEWQSFALRICNGQQGTLACWPPPAQFSPNNCPTRCNLFFQILKI
jgi:hypothetical protein